MIRASTVHPKDRGISASLGYASAAADVFIRITPAQVDLPKQAPVDFTVHRQKASREFDQASTWLCGCDSEMSQPSFARPTRLYFRRSGVRVEGEPNLIRAKIAHFRVAPYRS